MRAGDVSHVGLCRSAGGRAGGFAGPARRMVVSGLGSAGVASRGGGRSGCGARILARGGCARGLVRGGGVAVCGVSVLAPIGESGLVCGPGGYMAAARSLVGLHHGGMATARERSPLVAGRGAFGHGDGAGFHHDCAICVGIAVSPVSGLGAESDAAAGRRTGCEQRVGDRHLGQPHGGLGGSAVHHVSGPGSAGVGEGRRGGEAGSAAADRICRSRHVSLRSASSASPRVSRFLRWPASSSCNAG